MGQQYNKVQKRNRRKLRKKRQKAVIRAAIKKAGKK